MFINDAQNQSQKHIKIMRTDNDSDFLESSCQSLLHSKEIVHHRTCPYTPQQNGIVEPKHKHLLEVTRALLFHAGNPKTF